MTIGGVKYFIEITLSKASVLSHRLAALVLNLIKTPYRAPSMPLANACQYEAC